MSSSEVNIYLFFYWKMTNFDDRCTSFIVARFKALFHSLFFFFSSMQTVMMSMTE